MCLRDLMKNLHERGFYVTEAQIRWAIKTGKITRPPLDGSLRFDFGAHVQEIILYFNGKTLTETGTAPT